MRILTVALTGGIATGKSIIARILEGPDFFIHSADRAAHELMLPGCPAWSRIVARLGRGILNPDQTISRKRLGRIVFSAPADRLFLNRLLHPLVLEKKQQEVRKLERQGRPRVFVSEAALTIEAGLAPFFDRVVLAYCPESLQIERLMKRDGISRNEARKRIRSQMRTAEKIPYADYLIDTSRTLGDTEAQAEKLRRSLLADLRRRQTGRRNNCVSARRRARPPGAGS